MSRAHGGQQRPLLPFGNPLRIFRPKGSNPTPKHQVLLNSFENSLALSLTKLKPKDSSDILSFSWMSQAIALLSEAHANIGTLITEIQFPVSLWDENWVELYFDSSVKLLDICNALSSELGRLDQSRLLLKYVLHLLDFSSDLPSTEQLKRADAALCDWMRQRQVGPRSPRFESCLAIIQSLAGSLDLSKVKDSMKGKVLIRALYGVKIITVFICSVLTAALSGSSQTLMELHVSEKFLWSEAFAELQAAVGDEVRRRFSTGKITAIKELEVAEECARRLQGLISAVCSTGETTNMDCETRRISDEEVRHRLSEGIENMIDSAEKLGLGLDSLSKRVGDFFQVVLSGRNALLGNLREVRT